MVVLAEDEETLIADPLVEGVSVLTTAGVVPIPKGHVSPIYKIPFPDRRVAASEARAILVPDPF